MFMLPFTKISICISVYISFTNTFPIAMRHGYNLDKMHNACWFMRALNSRSFHISNSEQTHTHTHTQSMHPELMKCTQTFSNFWIAIQEGFFSAQQISLRRSSLFNRIKNVKLNLKTSQKIAKFVMSHLKWFESFSFPPIFFSVLSLSLALLV